jgi:hypothetical protein
VDLDEQVQELQELLMVGFLSGFTKAQQGGRDVKE